MSRAVEAKVRAWKANFKSSTVIDLANEALGEGQVRLDRASERDVTVYRCGAIVVREANEDSIAHALAHLILGHSRAGARECEEARRGATELLGRPVQTRILRCLFEWPAR